MSDGIERFLERSPFSPTKPPENVFLCTSNHSGARGTSVGAAAAPPRIEGP